MGNLRINPEQIQATQASFNVVEEESPNKAGDLLESSLTGTFEDTSGKVKAVAAGLKDAVTKLDSFLNQLAQAMAETDSELSESFTITTTYQKDKNERRDRERSKMIQLEKDLYKGRI